MQEERKNIRLWGLFTFWILVLNLVTYIGVNTDDMYFYTVGSASDFTYSAWIDQMWTGWSSRLIINCLCVFFAVAPHILWRILNTILIVMVPYFLGKISDTIKDGAALACMLFLLMPYIITGEAGWIATSVNYIFPATCLLACIYLLVKTVRESRVAKWEWPLYFIAACVATDAEQSCMIMAVVYAVFLAWMFYRERKYCRNGVAFLTGFTLLRLAMILICPGNAVRKGLIIKENYPEFGDFNLFQQFQAGIYSVASDTFLIFFAVTFLMAALLCILIWKKHREWYKRLTAVVPLVFNIGFPGYAIYLICRDYLMSAQPERSWFTSARNVLTHMGILGMKNTLWLEVPALFYVLVIVVFVCLLVAVYWAFDEKAESLKAVLPLFLGYCTKGMIGFTASVWLSHSRTGYYLVLSEMYVVLLLYKQWTKTDESARTKKFLFVLLPFAVLNAVISCAMAVLYARG